MKILKTLKFNKMKQLKYIFFVMLIGLLTACDENPPILFTDAVVVFEGNNQSITESVGGTNETPNSTTLTVSRTNTDISQALTLNYTAEAVLVSTGATVSNAFTISGTAGQITIPANAYEASITLSTVNNLDTDGAKEVTITLTGSDGNVNIGYPGPDSPRKSIKVIIEDDDCPFVIDNFLGDYDCDEPGYAVYDVSFSLKPGTSNTIINDNFWDFCLEIEYVLDPSTNTVTIPEQIAFDCGGTSRTVSGSGTIEPCTGKMTVDYTVIRTSTGAISDQNTHTFTRK